ncbi:hypothetical protein M0802_003676 [Mischocyttarus mexicanus]|nr:hypothetical protein M0802_003676 [Mischocyttarus mexicanus]
MHVVAREWGNDKVEAISSLHELAQSCPIEVSSPEVMTDTRNIASRKPSADIQKGKEMGWLDWEVGRAVVPARVIIEITISSGFYSR